MASPSTTARSKSHRSTEIVFRSRWSVVAVRVKTSRPSACRSVNTSCLRLFRACAESESGQRRARARSSLTPESPAEAASARSASDRRRVADPLSWLSLAVIESPPSVRRLSNCACQRWSSSNPGHWGAGNVAHRNCRCHLPKHYARPRAPDSSTLPTRSSPCGLALLTTQAGRAALGSRPGSAGR